MLQRTFLIIPSPYHVEHSHCMGPCLFLLHRGHSGSPSCNPAAVHQGKSHKGVPEGPPDIGRGANKCNQANWGFVQLSSYIHTYMHTYIHTDRQTHKQTYITYITYIHTYILTYIHTYISSYIQTYIKTYIHT